jgi:hypothetical protein
MILYRAAPRKEPYFGRGSYWTPSLNFVKSYRRWAHKTCPVLADRLVEARASEEVLNSARANQDLVLYRAEVHSMRTSLWTCRSPETDASSPCRPQW